MRGFITLVERDLQLALRQGADAAIAVVFFVLAAILFPFGIGPEPSVLARIAAGIIWVAALLASLLSLERLLQTDYDDGSLDQIALASLPLELVVLAKATAHWLLTGLPLIATAPVLAVVLRMDPAGFGILMVALAIGSPVLSLIGIIGAALTLGARRGGMLMSLLILPLYIPVLIFGAGAVEMAVSGLGARAHLLVLGGLLAAALPLAPFAAAAALRQALE